MWKPGGFAKTAPSFCQNSSIMREIGFVAFAKDVGAFDNRPARL
jgi:hypothetical protein